MRALFHEATLQETQDGGSKMAAMLGAAISSRCGSKRKHFCIVDVFFFFFLKAVRG